MDRALLAGLLLVACAASVATGAFLVSAALGFVVAGVIGAVLTVLLVLEVGGPAR